MSIEPSAETVQIARDRADRIRSGMDTVANLTDDITAAYRNRDHLQLGYDSWAAYVEAEFIEVSRMRLPRDKRRELVSTLEDEANMSTRAIAAVTGTSDFTVRKDLESSGARNHAPAKQNRSSRSVQGQDGKNYATTSARSAPTDEGDEIEEAEIVDEQTRTEQSTPAAPTPGDPAPPRKPRRTPLDKSARNAGHNMRLAANRIANVVHDDRFRQNRDQITRLMRRDLVHALETTQAALEQMPEIDPKTGELVE